MLKNNGCDSVGYAPIEGEQEWIHNEIVVIERLEGNIKKTEQDIQSFYALDEYHECSLSAKLELLGAMQNRLKRNQEALDKILESVDA